jgi:predicted house-cleaning noncanonical NTP pyrophosphatase (MazG superfamily)
MRKLIRDRYDEILPDNELELVKDDNERYDLLVAKLDEEIKELEYTRFNDVEEFGDVIEVLYALAEFQDIDRNQIMSAMVAKRMNKGIFKKGLILNR